MYPLKNLTLIAFSSPHTHTHTLPHTGSEGSCEPSISKGQGYIGKAHRAAGKSGSLATRKRGGQLQGSGGSDWSNGSREEVASTQRTGRNVDQQIAIII